MKKPKEFWLGRLDKGDLDLICLQTPFDEPVSVVEGEGWCEQWHAIEKSAYDRVIKKLKDTMVICPNCNINNFLKYLGEL